MRLNTLETMSNDAYDASYLDPDGVMAALLGLRIFLILSFGGTNTLPVGELERSLAVLDSAMTQSSTFEQECFEVLDLDRLVNLILNGPSEEGPNMILQTSFLTLYTDIVVRWDYDLMDANPVYAVLQAVWLKMMNQYPKKFWLLAHNPPCPTQNWISQVQLCAAACVKTKWRKKLLGLHPMLCNLYNTHSTRKKGSLITYSQS